MIKAGGILGIIGGIFGILAAVATLLIGGVGSALRSAPRIPPVVQDNEWVSLESAKAVQPEVASI